MFILGKIRINRHTELISPEDCIRLYRVIQKHTNIEVNKSDEYKYNTLNRVEILQQMIKTNFSEMVTFNEKYREMALLSDETHKNL